MGLSVAANTVAITQALNWLVELAPSDVEIRAVNDSPISGLTEIELDYIFCATDVKSFVASCISVSRDERFNIRVDKRTAAALVTILRAEVRGESMIDIVHKCLVRVDSQIERIVFDQQNRYCVALLSLAGIDDGTTIKAASSNGLLLATGLRIPMAITRTAVSDPGKRFARVRLGFRFSIEDGGHEVRDTFRRDADHAHVQVAP